MKHTIEQSELDTNLGSLIGTLHFVKLLTMKSLGIVKKAKEDITPKTVGVVLSTDIDIEVPVISCLKNSKTGVNKSDISTRKVRAGEVFSLNQFELMFFISRPEYSCYVGFNGDAKGLLLKTRMKDYTEGRVKLPTPYLTLTDRSGSLLDCSKTIDFKQEDGTWSVIPEYSEFIEMIPPRKRGITNAVQTVLPTGAYTNLAIHAILQEEIWGKK